MAVAIGAAPVEPALSESEEPVLDEPARVADAKLEEAEPIALEAEADMELMPDIMDSEAEDAPLMIEPEAEDAPLIAEPEAEPAPLVTDATTPVEGTEGEAAAYRDACWLWIEAMAEVRASMLVSVDSAAASDASELKAAELRTPPEAAEEAAWAKVMAAWLREEASAALVTVAAAAEMEAARAELVAAFWAAMEDCRAARDMAAVLVGSIATRELMAGSRVWEDWAEARAARARRPVVVYILMVVVKLLKRRLLDWVLFAGCCSESESGCCRLKAVCTGNTVE